MIGTTGTFIGCNSPFVLQIRLASMRSRREHPTALIAAAGREALQD